MSKIFLILLFSAVSIKAAVINLKAGEAITIQANRNTTVNCALDGGADCTDKVSRFKSRFDLCLSTSSVESCIASVWVDFRKSNPQCIEQASDYCLLKCNEVLDATWCLAKCQ